MRVLVLLRLVLLALMPVGRLFALSLMLMTTWLPLGAVITISRSNTRSTDLEAYILPANSSASSILTQAANGPNEADKDFRAIDLASVGRSGARTLSSAVEVGGRSLYSILQPAFEGPAQTQNWNIVVCETSPNGFGGEASDANGLDLFFALPLGWDWETFEGQTISNPSQVFTTAVSSGISLTTPIMADIQMKTETHRAGIAVHIADAEIGGPASTTTANRDCFSINLQHENVEAPEATSEAALANVYVFNGSVTSATTQILPGAATNSTGLIFAPQILAYPLSLSLANGRELISSFVRTGATETLNTETPTLDEKIADGAIRQRELGAQPSSVLRYKSQLEPSPIPGLIISEASAGAWNLFNGPASVRPAYTFVNGAYAYTANADTLVDNGTYLSLSCEKNGSTALIGGSPVITVLDSDLDSDESEMSFNSGYLSINIGRRAGFLKDPNDQKSRILIQGLNLTPVQALTEDSATNQSLECYAQITGRSRDASGGSLLQSLGVVSLTTLTTIASAPVSNSSTRLKTLSDTTPYTFELESPNRESYSPADGDSLLTVSIPAGTLSPRLPVTLTGSSTVDGPADTVSGLVKSDGSITLAIRSKNLASATMTAPALKTRGSNGILLIPVTTDAGRP